MSPTPAELAAILEDPACPWEDRRTGPDGWRRIQVDRLLAFAFVKGADLRGLEERANTAVDALGGRREPAGPGTALPYYRLPAAVAAPARTPDAARS
jgi:hypothetical protein